MSKIEKKREKLKERILTLETEMKKNLQQKTSNTVEINISKYLQKIELTNKQLQLLK